MLQEILNALHRIFLAYDAQDEAVMVSLPVLRAQEDEEPLSCYSNSMSGDRLVAVLDDKDNLINLGLRHVQQLRLELDLARLQIEDLQKENFDLKQSVQKLRRRLYERVAF